MEPPQIAEKEVVLVDPSQPFYIEGYHKPGALDPDDAVYDVIGDLLSSGRTSRLYRSLVRDKKVAAVAEGFPDFPGDKYPNLFIAYGVPLPGRTNDEVRDAIRAELERLKNEDVTDAELAMVKTRAKANLIRKLADNQGLANQLGSYQARYGDWRELFRAVERIDKVTKADIRRVASEIFVDEEPDRRADRDESRDPRERGKERGEEVVRPSMKKLLAARRRCRRAPPLPGPPSGAGEGLEGDPHPAAQAPSRSRSPSASPSRTEWSFS